MRISLLHPFTVYLSAFSTCADSFLEPGGGFSLGLEPSGLRCDVGHNSELESVPLACSAGHNSQLERATGLRCWPIAVNMIACRWPAVLAITVGRATCPPPSLKNLSSEMSAGNKSGMKILSIFRMLELFFLSGYQKSSLFFRFPVCPIVADFGKYQSK